MKFSSIFTLTTVAALTLAATNAYADKIGDKAKGLDISEWVKGQQVDVTDGKNVYVVEFWATWCPPCRKSIPHLTGLQKDYKDKNVVFVGISTEKLETVKPFVEEKGDEMNYTVAIDDSNKTSKNYMSAFDQHGIPTAFIVNKDARIVWVGHPMTIDKVLGEVVDGTYDLEKAIKEDELRAKKADLLSAFGKTSDSAELKKIAEEYIKLTEKDAEALSTLAENAFNKKEDSIAEMTLAAMSKIDDNAAKRAKSIKENALFERVLSDYKAAVKDGKADEAKDLAKKIEEHCAEDTGTIFYVAMTTAQELKDKADVKFLIKLIDIYDEKVKEDNGLSYSTDVYRVAVYLQCKDTENADKLTEKALDSCKTDDVRKSISSYFDRVKAQSK